MAAPKPSRVAALHIAAMPREACIVAAGKFGDSYCLLKNRDRNYVPKVKLVHEVRDGVEVAYLKDEKTGWIEGMNGHGVGVVNAALMVSRDESERDEVERTGKKLLDGDRILKALLEPTVAAAAKVVRTYKEGLRGHTVVSDGKKTLYVEMPDSNDVEYDEVPGDELFVRTNHGVEFPDAGYVEGPREESSKSRQEDAEEVLAEVDDPDDVAPALLLAREDRWEPTEMVRDHRSEKKMRTTTQMVLDLTSKKLILYLLPGRVQYLGLDDRLPDGFEPEITVEVREYDDLSEDTDGKTKAVSKKKADYRMTVEPEDLAFAEEHGLPVVAHWGTTPWRPGSSEEPAVPTAALFSERGPYRIFGWKRGDLSKFVLAEVPFDKLVPSQPTVPLIGLRRYAEGRVNTEVPDVVLHDGNLHVGSGHTRLSAGALRGEKRPKVKLYLYESRGWDKGGYRKPTEADVPPGVRIVSRTRAASDGLLPVLDPAFNLREIFKQLVLLEDHLFHERKRCPDCIWKHLLTAEALAEEAVTLDTERKHANVPGLAEEVRGLQRAIRAGVDLHEVAQQARVIRKGLLGVASTVKVGATVEVLTSRDFPVGEARSSSYTGSCACESPPAASTPDARSTSSSVGSAGLTPQPQIAVAALAPEEGTRAVRLRDAVARRWLGGCAPSTIRGGGNTTTPWQHSRPPTGPDARSAAIGTSRWTGDTSSSTVTSWSSSSGASSAQTRASTTSTGSGTTTDPRTLNSGRATNPLASACRTRFDGLVRSFVATETPILTSDDLPSFAVGDVVTFGRFQNKPARIVRMWLDDRGIPMVEVEPVPKGRKKNRTFGLFRVRHADPAKRVASAWLRESTNPCSTTAVSFAWVDPQGDVHDAGRGHPQWAQDYVSTRPALTRRFRPDEGHLATEVLLEDGWIRVSNFLNMEVWNTHTPTRAAWASVVDVVSSCVVRSQRDPFGLAVTVWEIDKQFHRYHTHPLDEFVEKFGGREAVEQMFGGLMVKAAKARYKEKKKVKTRDGDEATVYVYSEKQVQHRHREKAKRYESLGKDIDSLREQVAKDIDSGDPKLRLTALAVALIDATFERVGNDDSADEGHFGVTGWLKKHVTFGKGKATIRYVGKSGVDHEKVVDDAKLVKALKDCCGDKKPDDPLLSFGKDDSEGVVRVTSRDVNEYLKPFDVTAKDLRGFHANREMQDQLRKVRKAGPKLPTEKKEREKVLKAEFKEALEATAEAVGHEAATLRTQYLVPGLEDTYMKDGTVMDKLRDASRRVADEWLRKASTRYVPLHVVRAEPYPMPEKPTRVWEWSLGQHPPTERSRPAPGNSIPSDENHDWKWRGGTFRYTGTGGRRDAWLLLQFGPDTAEFDDEKTCSSCGAPMPGSGRFCPSCGVVQKVGTKSDAEKEQEEVERLSRPSPKKKPPRDDSKRERLDMGDPDLDTRDKDLSLNYKDIG